MPLVMADVFLMKWNFFMPWYMVHIPCNTKIKIFTQVLQLVCLPPEQLPVQVELGRLVNLLSDGPRITQTQICQGGASESFEVNEDRTHIMYFFYTVNHLYSLLKSIYMYI